MGIMDKVSGAANRAAVQAIGQARQSMQNATGANNGEAPAGWYPDSIKPGHERYWDGAAWTQNIRPTASSASPGEAVAQTGIAGVDMPYWEFTSHIAGKNAKVRLYADRLEWKREGVSAGKVAAGVLTGGLSIAATGVRVGNAGTQIIPIDQITAVTTRRDSMLNDIVSVVASGNTIDFRVSKAEAAQMKSSILQARSHERKTIYGAGPQQPIVIHNNAIPVSSQAEPSQIDRLKQLAELHAAGILSDEEFSAAKAKAIGI